MISKEHGGTMVPRTRLRALLATAACAVVAALVAAPSASAAFGVTSYSMSLTDPAGQPLLEAGAHPDVTTSFSLRKTTGAQPVPDGNMRSISVDLPPGLIGNPTAIPRCRQAALAAGAGAECPAETQAGTVTITNYIFGNGFPTTLPVYNMEPPPGIPGQYGFNVLGVLVFVDAEVRGNDYGLRANIGPISQALSLGDIEMTLWGVPADPAHDAERWLPSGGIGAPSSAPRRPMMSNPTSCTGRPLESTLRAQAWGESTVHTVRSTTDKDGNPLVITGCDGLRFTPSMTVQPTSRRAADPTGLAIDLTVPQNQAPGGVAAAHLRRAVVRFPEGVTLNPGSADGQAACSPAAIGIGSAASPTCPDASKLGTVEIDTPLLEEPLKGSIYLAQPRNNPFSSLVSIYVVAEGSGVVIKLPGRIDLDPSSGRLTAVFDNNPQQPFDKLSLRFNGGPRAALAAPPRCGTYTTSTEMTSWASDVPVHGSDTFTINEGCERADAFAPRLTAGLMNPAAGSSSSFVLELARDGGANVHGMDITLPRGLLATVRGIPLCEGAAAAAGSCSEASRVGHTSLAVGPGPSPVWLPQPGRAATAVYLGGPYKGAPYSLVIKVPAQVGPFDLGQVVVRAAVFVDPVDAHLRVLADPLPQILEGIPIEYRRIRVTMDRPGFMRAPTSCAERHVYAAVDGADARVARMSSRMQMTGCRALPYAPKVSLKLEGKSQTKVGGHPRLRARVTQRPGESGLRDMAVTLPLALALDPETSQSERLCEYEDGLKAQCPKASIVGTATAHTPILNRPLTGPVHFVKGVRFGRDGRRIRTLPTLLIKLHGEVDLILRARSQVKDERLVARFESIPDAPISRFDLKLNAGKRGILVVTRKLCGERHVASIRTTGQSGKRYTARRSLTTPCGKSSTSKKKKKKTTRR